VRNAFRSKTKTTGLEKPAPDESAAESQAIDAFLGGLVIAPVKNSRLVDVVYRSPDPVVATTIVNELARQYIQQNVELRFHTSKDASEWLGQQLAEQRKKVEASEMALQRFREDNDAVSLEDRQNIVVQKLADLNAAVTAAKNEKISKETAYNRLLEIAVDRAKLDTFPAILSNGFVQQLKSELADAQHKQAQLSETLGDKHPELIKARSAVEAAQVKLNTEIEKVVESVHNEYLTALAREQDLVAALNAQKAEALAQNRKAIGYGALQRDAASNRQMFEALLQRTKETGLSEELRATNVRIVDAAEVPRSPAGPNTRSDLLFAMLTGGVLAIGLVFGLEYLDNRIKSPDEISAHLRIPCLGLVPAAPCKHATDGAPLINNGVPAHFSEAFRTIRTNVLFSSVDEGSRTIVVTSTGPGEGKTIVSSNLALALAQARQRVLLVDGDLRRPQVHSYFSHLQEPGLSNFIVGNAEAGDVIRASGIPDLWLLPSGLVPPNPAELLGSARFKDFLATLKERFDWVIIDSPPVMAVTDACVMAHLAHGVLFVVGAEMTSRKAARRALKQLELARARFMGAVLNRVDVDHHGHYYSSYYSPAYGRYYGAAVQKGTS
jgi:succinoglycan biosynthesis transport protein ExoP